MEVWKDIEELPGYQVSSLGRVKSLNYMRQGFEQILKIHIAKNQRGKGYYRVVIQQKCYLVHRLQAKAFLLNPDEKPEVDHINRDSLDNRLENIKWATKSEQNINRTIRLPASGERNIHILKGWYQVKIKRNCKVICGKVFRTLEEAIQFRNEFLKNNL